MKFQCRHCREKLDNEVINLGSQPASNAYLSKEDLLKPEITYPLKVYICKKCWLMQIPEYAKPEELFKADYAYFSSTSKSWCMHAKNYVNQCIEKKIINKKSFVVEIASNDGYLLQYVKEKGIKCLGIEPTFETSQIARSKGINTLNKFFGEYLVDELKQNYVGLNGADLIIANNVIAHVPNVNDFVKGLASLVSDNGLISIEFPHLLKLLKLNQFDTIYHEHFSYFSLRTIKRIALFAGLKIVGTEELRTHGGSLRVWLMKNKSVCNTSDKNISKVLREESEGKLESIDTYKKLQTNAEKIKNSLIEFLIHNKNKGSEVHAYGAAAKGNTLLNFAGIRSDLIKSIADKSLSKQNKFLPGSHIPIISPEDLFNQMPNKILIMPWNIADEIKNEYRNYNFYTSIPYFRKIS